MKTYLQLRAIIFEYVKKSNILCLLLALQTVQIFAQIKEADRSILLVGKVLDSFTEIGQNGT